MDLLESRNEKIVHDGRVVYPVTSAVCCSEPVRMLIKGLVDFVVKHCQEAIEIFVILAKPFL